MVASLLGLLLVGARAGGVQSTFLPVSEPADVDLLDKPVRQQYQRTKALLDQALAGPTETADVYANALVTKL